MSISKIKTRLNNLEIVLYRMINVFSSALIGFVLSKTDFLNSFSPFTISYLAVSPASGLSVVSTYVGIFIGYLTDGFLLSTFKYICASTIILVLIILSGRRNYFKSVYSHILPGAVCFIVGVLFLFAESFTVYSFLLVALESVLCSCTSYFMLYFFTAINKKSKLDIKDVISVNITLIVLLCAVDSFYIYGFSVSGILLQVLIYVLAYYFDFRFSSLFTLSLCIVMSLLHSENLNFFLYFYIPTLVSIIASKLDKKHIVVSYFITQATVISFTGFSLYSIKIILTPLISGLIFKFIPKKKLGNFISEYIFIQNSNNENFSNDELCAEYCQSANKISDLAFKKELSPILRQADVKRIEGKLRKMKCKNIRISYYCNLSGKQLIEICCENKKGIYIKDIENNLQKIGNFNLVQDKSEGKILRLIFEEVDNFTVECYALYKSKCGEDVCGDCAAAFKIQQDKYYMIIADGMGSGKEAYAKSINTINVIKKLLKIEVDPINAIKTANSSIYMLNNEIGFSTVDLCCISLKSGVADFYKCGAYVTYLLRNKTLTRIKENGFPVGLEEQIVPSATTICLQNKDIIVMMSDGAANSIEHIEDYLVGTDSNNLEVITREIMNCATNNTPKGFDDDTTIIVSRITEKNIS